MKKKVKEEGEKVKKDIIWKRKRGKIGKVKWKGKVKEEKYMEGKI